MNNIKLDITKAACFLEAGAVKAFEPQVKAAQKALEEGTCPGNDFFRMAPSAIKHHARIHR